MVPKGAQRLFDWLRVFMEHSRRGHVVIINSVFLKSIVRPFESVRRPSSKILNKGELPTSALYRATEALERSAGLMEINFNQAAALELFFLRSLRIWTLAR